MNYDNNVALIDADSLVYLVGAGLQDIRIEAIGCMYIDERITSLLAGSKCAKYMGFFGMMGGDNFRDKIAVTVPYKHTRKMRAAKDKMKREALIAAGEEVEEEWFKFWEPVLKSHMEIRWRFQAVNTIEADDACIIAKRALEDKYDKIVILAIDKDLLQEEGYHYNYSTNIMKYVPLEESISLLAAQLIKGDSADSIPGIPGLGKGSVDKYMTAVDVSSLEAMKKSMLYIYMDYFRNVLVEKEMKRQEKEYLKNYKIEYGIPRYTAQSKSDALGNFKFNSSDVKTLEEVRVYFKEQYQLLHMLDTEEKGREHGFILGDVQTCTNIDWEEIAMYEEDIEPADEEDDFDFLDEL